MIPEEKIQEVLEKTNIVEIVEEHFPLKRRGTNFLALCPFHGEKTPSFNVNPQTQRFKCFGCDVGGNAIKFVMLHENLDFREALFRLAGRAGVTIHEEFDPRAEARQKGRKELLRLQKAAADWFHHNLFRRKTPNAQAARQYLTSRQVSMDTAKRWNLGYAPENQRDFFEWSRSAGFGMEVLVDGGMAKWSDENNRNRGAYTFFRKRLMFPVNNDFGEPIAFSGRHVMEGQTGGKYVNSPETSIFKKSKTFFGLDKTKRSIYKQKKVIIFEGQLDLMSAYEGGIDYGIAPLGTAFTRDHAHSLKRHTDEVILCYDSDGAGVAAAVKAFRLLAPIGMLVRLAMLPSGHDPDSLIKSSGIEALREILDSAPEFFDFQIDRRSSEMTHASLRERINFVKELARDIGLIDDKMLQDSLISRISVRLGVGEDEVRKEVSDAVQAIERAERTSRKREAVRERVAKERGIENVAGGKRPPGRGSVGTIARPEPAALRISNRSIRTLCKCLLQDSVTKAKLQSRELPEFLRHLTETEVLTYLWHGQYEAGQVASVNTFISTLPPLMQSAIDHILNEESPEGNWEIARGCILSLKRKSVQNQIGVTKSQLGASNLPPAETERLNKQLLDLYTQLNDIGALEK